MRAFHNDPKIKEKYLNRVTAHEKADEIVQGIYWENDRGCAVGCTLHSADHSAYETELGIPKWLARVEDTLFEGMPIDDAKLWPRKFLEVIPVGVDLEQVKAPFLIYVLNSALESFDNKKHPDCTKAITTVIKLYESGETDLDKFAAADAADAAYAAYAADAAADAAYAAADAARENKHKEFADELLRLMEAE